ncbi:MAG TPA: S9 family peptidase [Bacteroidota bacterium]|nr:S9 family peptidase [Bacteroidota bacterium]
MKRIPVVLTALCIALAAFAQSKRPITFDDLISLGRLGAPAISSDGRTVAFVVTYFNKTENSSSSNIYLVPASGGEVRQLTSAKRTNHSPQWSPDGKTIAFVSTRDGESQIWTIPVDGGEARKISSISTGVSGLDWSPDGKWFAFSSEVFPDCPDDDCNQKRNEQAEKSKVKAKVFETLPYRVFNYWKDGKRSHLFVMPAEGGQAIDLTPGDYDTPPIDLGGSWDYAFSPDSKEMVFTRNTDPLVAISTNNDLFVVPVTGGTAKRITENRANDSQPIYSPDGRYIAYRRMNRAGFESDQNQLVLYERATGNMINLTEKYDYSVAEAHWSPDSKSLFFTADNKGNHSIFRISLPGKQLETIVEKGYNHHIAVSPDGKFLLFLRETINQPAELFRVDVSGKNLRRLTSVNAERVSRLDMNPLEDFWFDGAEGTKVHGWIVKPPAFDAKRKYPVIYLVHGGPQGQWGDQFHYRWNAQMFASRGYVVAMVNPHGSTGYGQAFTDKISGDWGGRVYEDLMKGVEFISRTYPFIDGSRIAAAGASYGGYMMNWMMVNTDRFKCYVSHAGMFNAVSKYGTTEELWFPEWEFKGIPYEQPELYQKWSPITYARNLAKYKTPTLVTHGQLDYRVDVSEGFQLFTALQRLGVKSKMVYFPDEGHWIAKPQNSEYWYKTVLDWIDEHTKGAQAGTLN